MVIFVTGGGGIVVLLLPVEALSGIEMCGKRGEWGGKRVSASPKSL